MPNPTIYTTKPFNLRLSSFYPRNYEPVYIFVRDKLKDSPTLRSLLASDVKGGSTPPYYLFEYEEDGIPFVKTSAIDRDLINLNDLHYIHPEFHKHRIKRSITRPYDVVYSMTGKFMGKAALCPPCITELNMSQNSVVLRTKSPLHSAFLTIFLNSMINRTQILGIYSITKQKYLNQGKIADLKILDYSKDLESSLTSYLEGIEQYYSAVTKLKHLVEEFNEMLRIDNRIFRCSSVFQANPEQIDLRMLTPQFYRLDFNKAITACGNDEVAPKLLELDRKKGNEIGSKNYGFEGIPFIRTSDFLNFDVDYQPNYYCSDTIYNSLAQDLKRGDILVAKDGKVGEIGILQHSAKVVICSGLVRIRLSSDDDRYWLFLLLTSNYGQLQFNRWTVIASTMAHLRKDFFAEFKLPKLELGVKSKYIKQVADACVAKEEAHSKIDNSKAMILEKWEHYIEKSVNT
jgi:type I restriction enzyme S subunit